MPRGSFEPVTDMLGGGPFSLKPGQWTDDTSMALSLAESLIEKAVQYAAENSRTTDTFRDAILKATNLGDDADTTAAICGQLAGAHHGESGIPAEWLDKLCMREMLHAQHASARQLLAVLHRQSLQTGKRSLPSGKTKRIRRRN